MPLPLCLPCRPPVAFSKPLHGLSCAEHYALGLVEGGAEACSLFRINAERVTQELAAGSVPTAITAPHPDDSSHFIALGGGELMAQVLAREGHRALAAAACSSAAALGQSSMHPAGSDPA